MTASEPLSVATHLSISVVGTASVGPTALAAFDEALRSAGVANFNLVRLSSVIPPGSIVTAGPSNAAVAPPATADAPIDIRARSMAAVPQGTWGDRLYAVWAFESAQLLGQEAWAGVAWAQDPEDGRGVFVEHEGASEAQVREELAASLSAICGPRGLSDAPQQSVVVGAQCTGLPVGALVIAPYEAEPWSVGGHRGI